MTRSIFATGILALFLVACGSSDEGNPADQGPEAGADVAAVDSVVPADVPGVDGVVPADVAGTDTTPLPPVKVDLLLIVDDSASMCQEQSTLAKLFDTLLTTLGNADLRIAVTTTNVCAKDKAGAVRGKFVYQPASGQSVSPECVEKRVVACLSDADCHADSSLPDAQNWVCDTKPAAYVHSCDKTPAPVTLDTVNSNCRYRCTKDADSCSSVFSDTAYACLYPGGDSSRAGCLKAPGTSTCPADGPTVLDATAVDKYLKAWKDGSWAGDSAWAGKADADVRPLIQARLFACLTTVGTAQVLCGNQEQGLLAAWLALDPAGENADQAKAFVRSDAVLLVFVVSDENDCSAVSAVAPELYGQCGCLADTKGCTPDGTCGQTAGPLYAVDDLATNLKALKADSSKVVFAAVTGDVIPGSATTPGADLDASRKRYYECKCPATPGAYSPMTYACQSPTGRADLGSRFQGVAAAFGDHGIVSNLCDPDGIRNGLVSAAAAARKAAGL